MAIIQDLPPELIDLILVHFRKREYALRTCSLLSKSWRTATLPHLFSTFRPTLKGGDPVPQDVSAFLESHAHIAACVKHLWLRNWTTVDACLVRTLLSLLPAVERLSLELTRFVSASPGLRVEEDTTNDRCAPRIRLQTMIVNHCYIDDDLSNLMDILALFEVETFKAMFVKDFRRGADSLGEPAISCPCVRIRDLRLGAHKRLREPSPTALLRLLRAALVPGYLRSVEFLCDSLDTLELTGVLLREVGQNVTTFKLKLLGLVLLEGTNVLAGRWNDLQLSSCPRLETFHLHAPSYLLGPGPNRMSTFTTYADILRQLPQSVRTITLKLSRDIELVLAEDQSAVETSAMERAILDDKQSRFPELEAVVLELDIVYADECAALAAKLMPRLHDSGLLRTTLI